MKKVPAIDVNKDFTPITDIGRFTLFLVVNSELPVKDLRELIAYAKANPGKLSYGSGNTAGFVSMAQIKALAGIDMVHVPYKGEPAAMTDLIGNRVRLMFSNLTTAMPHIRNGKLRPITLTLATRSPLLPDVPAAESGLQGFSIISWNALFGPAGMSRDVVDKLNQAFAQAVTRPEVIETLGKQGIPVKSCHAGGAGHDGPYAARELHGSDACRRYAARVTPKGRLTPQIVVLAGAVDYNVQADGRNVTHDEVSSTPGWCSGR